MKREHRYIVLKIKDVAAALNADERAVLGKLLDRTEYQRHLDGKTPLRGVFIEQDWPEYEAVWRMLEVRSDQAAREKECAEHGHTWARHHVIGPGASCTRCLEWRIEENEHP